MLGTRNPLPARSTCTARQAGLTWDAIVVPRALGRAAVTILGPRCGAVVDDLANLYWFVAHGSADGLTFEHATVLAEQQHTVAIPPARLSHGPGPHWAVCPGDSDWLTDVRALQAALEDCLHSHPGSAPDAGSRGAL
ncbi:hypothetical protein [Streptomyces sp. Midd1]|uniref:hypothetical protein n=1 Tax=Streptomyces sp. Midd3 TaxID=3161191 RepID=UPI0034DB1323